MERESILHGQSRIPMRKPTAYPSLTLALRTLEGSVVVYSIDEERQSSELGTLPAGMQSVCIFQNHLVALNQAGEVRFGPVTPVELPARSADFTGIQRLSASKDHLVLLTADNELLFIDERLEVSRRARFAHPIKDLHLGEESTLWIAGGEAVLGGHQVFWSADWESFRQIPWPASAVALYGDRDGIVWTVNSNTEIWKLHRLGEGNMPGCRQDTSCRNCMFKSYKGAARVASVEGLFLVLHPDGTLRGHPFPGASEVSLVWRDVAHFAVSVG